MSPAVAFHTQVASIMEVLANAAVAEICELMDGGYSVLQQEISRSRKENEALRRKLRLMELKAARANALRAVSTASSILASSRARAQLPAHPGNELRRTPGGLVLLPRGSTQVRPRCGAAEPSVDTGQRKSSQPAVEPPKVKTPVIKEEKEDESWANPEQDKAFRHAVDGQPKESTTETEASPAATKQEVAEQDSGRSCPWASGEVSATPLSVPKNLTANKRPEDAAGLPEPVGYDCMMYELQLQHGSHGTQNPSSEDPGCSYSLNTSISISAPSDTGSSFPFAISEATHPLTEHQQPAAFPDNRQRAPLPADEPQIPVRKEPAPVANAFIVREDWQSQSQDSFSSASNYSRDESGGKSFVCTFCGKTLACLKNLKTHMRVHTGEKPYGCALCSKHFSDSSNLKRHQSVHTGEKRYGCVHCGKRFAQSGSLKVHMSVHTGCKQFRCPHCGRTFISANHLRRHISIHGEKQLPPTFQ